MEKTFARFPQAINDMADLVSNYLMEERDKAKYLIDCVVDMEINYLFTNDYNYLNNFTTFIPKQKPNQENTGALMIIKVEIIILIINLNHQLMQKIYSLKK